MKKGWIILGGLFFVSIALGLMAGRVIVPLKVENQTGDSRMKPSWLLANIFAIKQGYTGKFYKIVVQYTEEEQSRMNLFGGDDGVLVQNFNYKVEEGVLKIWVYYNPVKRDEILTQEGWVNRDVWAMMCAVAEGPKRDECYQKASSFGEWSKKYLRLSLVPSAYAYSWCSGTVLCGVLEASCACSSGSGPLFTCSTDGYGCGPWYDRGTCSCSTDCNETKYTSLDCSDLSTQANCNNGQSFCYSGGECPVDQSCTWNSCPDPGTCPTTCGYAGGTVPNGWCGSISCAATPSCCSTSSPSTPTLSSPANATQVRVGSAVSLGWNAVASWGTNCSGNVNRYEVCVMSGATCDLVNYANNGTSLTYNWTPLAADSVVTWKIRANNGAASAESSTRTVCAEGFNASNPTYVSAWTPACGNQTRTCTENCGTDDCAGVTTSQCTECGPFLGAWTACDSNHKRTRTCTESCGTDDCTAAGAVAGVITEDCIGTIQGTLFDASDVSGCSAAEIAASPKFGNQTFGLSPTPDPLKWPVISVPVVTNVSGVYSESVYASATWPANYVFDYSSLISSGLAAGVKTECGVSMAAVTTQSQVVTKNTGFWRVYGGWWQAVGGNVYAETGLKSYIPASVLPLTNQKLILADADGRTGVLSHGFSWAGSELGTNPNVAVSSSLWRIESLYEGLRYDYDFYKTRMDIFASTPWAGGGISYNDGGTGYQIFKGSGDLGLSATTLAVGQKAILLVDGSVSVNGDLVVPVGAFLGVIAKNGITFAAGVDTAQGWFVAESINVSCNETAGVCNQTDTQFDGQGSFVGWSGINLDRDMYTGNNTAPSEKFTYRTDMYLNAPAPIKVYARKFSPFIP